MSKVIILAPHPDDEVLGCFTFLNLDTLVIYVTSFHPLYPDGENVQEMLELVQKYKFAYTILEQCARDTNILDVPPIHDLIDIFEDAIMSNRPETILVPAPSYNQDHRIVYDAALTAMRHHDRIPFVKRILLYEQPETFDTLRKPDPFNARYFRSVNIQEKLEAVQIYNSQIRRHRSLDYIWSIAKVRGEQSNLGFAEAFEVVRWVE